MRVLLSKYELKKAIANHITREMGIDEKLGGVGVDDVVTVEMTYQRKRKRGDRLVNDGERMNIDINPWEYNEFSMMVDVELK